MKDTTMSNPNLQIEYQQSRIDYEQRRKDFEAFVEVAKTRWYDSEGHFTVYKTRMGQYFAFTDKTRNVPMEAVARFEKDAAGDWFRVGGVELTGGKKERAG